MCLSQKVQLHPSKTRYKMRDAGRAKQTLLSPTDRLIWKDGLTSSQREAFKLKRPLNTVSFCSISITSLRSKKWYNTIPQCLNTCLSMNTKSAVTGKKELGFYSPISVIAVARSLLWKQNWFAQIQLLREDRLCAWEQHQVTIAA